MNCCQLLQVKSKRPQHVNENLTSCTTYECVSKKPAETGTAHVKNRDSSSSSQAATVICFRTNNDDFCMSRVLQVR